MTEQLKRVFFEVPDKPRNQVLAPAFREPDPPAPFKFQVGELWLNVRPEKRGNSWYWYVNNQIDGRRHRVYIAPVGELTRGKIEAAAKKIPSVTVAAAGD